jgi:hypothetical protein
MLAFHIGGESANFVRVAIVGDSGQGWLPAKIEVAAGAFRGSYSADLTSMALSRFATELEKLYAAVSGTAVFTDYEGQLELRMVCDVRGHIRLKGEAMDIAGTGNKLTFELELDQTNVPPVLTSLKSCVERHPARAV